MTGVPKESPEIAAPRVVASFFTEYLPGVEKEFELLVRAGEGPLKISLFDFQMETLIFGLHCLDRAVFPLHGENYRADFMDCALAAASEFFSAALPDDARNRFLDSFQNHYNTRQREFGEMKLLPASDKALAGVLSWEYAKRLCLNAGVHDTAVVLVMFEGAKDIFTMMNRVAQTL